MIFPANCSIDSVKMPVSTELRDRPGCLPRPIAQAFESVRTKLHAFELDRKWKDYMAENRGRDNMLDYLVNSLTDRAADPEIQDRCLQTLLSPDMHELPFRINTEDSVVNYLRSFEIRLGTILTDAQAVRAAELVEFYINQVESKEHKNDNDIDALERYNSIILRLLPRLSQEPAETLFEKFKINDIAPCSSWGKVSGYYPLPLLYSDPEIAEVFKRKAAERIHRVIEMELSGEAQPRTDWEGAVECYSGILSTMTYLNDPPIGRKFYQDEIAFMLGQKTGKPVVDPRQTAKVMSWLDPPGLKYLFARRQILPKEGLKGVKYFYVHDEGTLTDAQRIKAKYPNDQDLVDRLNFLIEGYQSSQNK